MYNYVYHSICIVDQQKEEHKRRHFIATLARYNHHQCHRFSCTIRGCVKEYFFPFYIWKQIEQAFFLIWHQAVKATTMSLKTVLYYLYCLSFYQIKKEERSQKAGQDYVYINYYFLTLSEDNYIYNIYIYSLI